MKLIKFITPVMVETKLDDQLGLDSNYMFVDTVDTNIHIDIHNIESIYTFGLSTGIDYISYITYIKTLYISIGGFNNLSSVEKNIIAKLAICTLSEAISIGYTEDDFDIFIDNLADKTKQARSLRVEKARKDFSRELKKGTITYTESNILLADVSDYFNAYIVGNNPEFIRFITDSDEFVNAGFSSKSYYTEDRKTKLINRIINGL